MASTTLLRFSCRGECASTVDVVSAFVLVLVGIAIFYVVMGGFYLRGENL